MERKPRYYIEYEVLALLDDGVGHAKPQKRLCTTSDLEFMLGLAAPTAVDGWMLAARLLRRKEQTVFKIKGARCSTKITVTRN